MAREHAYVVVLQMPSLHAAYDRRLGLQRHAATSSQQYVSVHLWLEMSTDFVSLHLLHNNNLHITNCMTNKKKETMQC